ncbi:MAG: hypothetical protein ACLR9W_16350 [Enterobacter hormaechei]
MEGRHLGFLALAVSLDGHKHTTLPRR